MWSDTCTTAVDTGALSWSYLLWAIKLIWREAPKNKLGAKRPNKTQRCVKAPIILPVSARSSRVFALPNPRPVLYRFPQPRYLEKRAILS